MTRLGLEIGREVSRAIASVREGRLVIYPTETVYGLGCDPFNPEAVQRLVRAKQRKKSSLPVLLDSVSRAEDLATLDNGSRYLAKRFWPGALTIVVPCKKTLSGVTDDQGFVGLRVSSHPTAHELAVGSGGAIIGTSANLSGGKSPNTIDKIPHQLSRHVDVIINGGRTGGLESTVVKLTGNVLNIIREGQISKSEIIRALQARDSVEAGRLLIC